jgi:DNA polymerase-4
MDERTIFHVDMDAFFASVEQRSRPGLRGKAIAVTGSGKRTVITTASYEARAAGVRTGMSVFEARRACPWLRLVVGDNRKYAHTSSRIISIFNEFAPMVEVYSIDEAFLDMTGSLRLMGSPEVIAGDIKERIRQDTGLTCSIGIAPNRMLAKLASGMEKPDGLVRIQSESISDWIDSIPIGKICGIGEKLCGGLAELGIRTCGELGRFSLERLRQRFGFLGERLASMGKGVDDTPVISLEKEACPKSLGHSTTLPENIADRERLQRELLRLSEMVARRARRNHLCGRIVTLTLRYSDFRTFSRRTCGDHFIRHGPEIYLTVKDLLNSVRLEKSVRLVGVTLSGLTGNDLQMPLFQIDQRKEKIDRAMDRINDRYGRFTVTRATLLNHNQRPGVISPAWRPEGTRHINVK